MNESLRFDLALDVNQVVSTILSAKIWNISIAHRNNVLRKQHWLEKVLEILTGRSRKTCVQDSLFLKLPMGI